jgi:hypothetical protein
MFFLGSNCWFQKRLKMRGILIMLFIICVFAGKSDLMRNTCRAETPFPDVCADSLEMEVFRMINEYRIQHGLDPVPHSVSLTKVAKLHAVDLTKNNPDTGACNLHSWSPKGSWSPCCYTRDHRQSKCMWDKPSELTSYPGKGFEVAFYGNGGRDLPKNALTLWKGSKGHHNLLLNQGMWRNTKFHAMGAGISGNYVCVWLGREPDPLGEPLPCR